MPDIRGYINQHLSQLSYTHEEPKQNLPYNQAFPGIRTPDEKGSFDELEIRSSHVRAKVTADKHAEAQRIGLTDTPRTYQNVPIGLGFELFEADLQQWKARNYRSRQGMINEHQGQIANILKKEKEAQLWTVVDTDANFEGVTYYANAATAWSTHATADPTADVMAGFLITDTLNAAYMSHTAFRHCIQCTNVLGATTVSGPKRDRALAPVPTVEHLMNLWGLNYIFVSNGKFITDSSLPSDETTTEIWGDEVLLFWHDPRQTQNSPSFLKHTFWDVPGGSSDEGWVVAYERKPLAGGLGLHVYDTWNYFSFLVHEATYGYRIDAVY